MFLAVILLLCFGSSCYCQGVGGGYYSYPHPFAYGSIPSQSQCPPVNTCPSEAEETNSCDADEDEEGNDEEEEEEEENEEEEYEESCAIKKPCSTPKKRLIQICPTPSPTPAEPLLYSSEPLSPLYNMPNTSFMPSSAYPMAFIPQLPSPVCAQPPIPTSPCIIEKPSQSKPEPVAPPMASCPPYRSQGTIPLTTESYPPRNIITIHPGGPEEAKSIVTVMPNTMYPQVPPGAYVPGSNPIVFPTTNSATQNSGNSPLPDGTDNNFNSEVINPSQNQKVVVIFYRNGCGPCQQLQTLLNQLSPTLRNQTKIIEVNIETNPALTSQYQIDGTPITLVIHKGSEIKRKRGSFSSLQALENWVNSNTQ